MTTTRRKQKRRILTPILHGCTRNHALCRSTDTTRSRSESNASVLMTEAKITRKVPRNKGNVKRDDYILTW